MQTILIVDDDVATVDNYSRILRLDGYRVVTARTASDGFQMALKESPAAILIDLHMPVMNGDTLLAQVRAVEQLRDVPAVVVTGDYFLADSVTDRLRDLGAQVQFKPLWVEDLVELVRSLLGRETRTESPRAN